MNIKTLASEPILSISTPKSANKVRAEGSFADRDADGRRGDQNDEQYQSLSEEEFDKALKLLSEHKGIKGNNLKVEFEWINERRIVLVKDQQGGLVRRIAEPALSAFLREKESSKGHLLNKSA